MFTHLTDAQRIAQCDVDTYRASGPGGQKRNKTSSAVRLRHAPTGLIVIAEESRSQHENKARALRRLYRALFLELRDPPPTEPAAAPEIVAALRGGRLDVSAKDPRFWPAAGVVLDVLLAAGAEVSTAAAAFGLTTANLVAFLQTDPKLWQTANRFRLAAGLHALTM